MSKIIDMTLDENGVFKASGPAREEHEPIEEKIHRPRKKKLPEQDMFEGFDRGMDFIEGITKRFDRVMRLGK